MKNLLVFTLLALACALVSAQGLATIAVTGWNDINCNATGSTLYIVTLLDDGGTACQTFTVTSGTTIHGTFACSSNDGTLTGSICSDSLCEDCEDFTASAPEGSCSLDPFGMANSFSYDCVNTANPPTAPAQITPYTPFSSSPVDGPVPFSPSATAPSNGTTTTPSTSTTPSEPSTPSGSVTAPSKGTTPSKSTTPSNSAHPSNSTTPSNSTRPSTTPTKSTPNGAQNTPTSSASATIVSVFTIVLAVSLALLF